LRYRRPFHLYLEKCDIYGLPSIDRLRGSKRRESKQEPQKTKKKGGKRKGKEALGRNCSFREIHMIE